MKQSRNRNRSRRKDLVGYSPQQLFACFYSLFPLQLYVKPSWKEPFWLRDMPARTLNDFFAGFFFGRIIDLTESDSDDRKKKVRPKAE
jgi:hypothetical protein